MIMKKMVWKAAWVVALLVSAVATTHALSDSQISAAAKAVTLVPAPEIPAKAVQIVMSAPAKDRKAVAYAVVKTAIRHNKSTARLVVSSVAKAAPETASLIAALAAEMVKDEAVFIAGAASTAAPSQTSAIEASVASAVPEHAAEITRGSARVGPPTAGTVIQTSTPINQVNRQGLGGNSFPNATTSPPISAGTATPLPANYQRTR